MKKYIAYVEKHRDLILAANDYIWKNPETGYREWKTHAYLAEIFRNAGYELPEALSAVREFDDSVWKCRIICRILTDVSSSICISKQTCT